MAATNVSALERGVPAGQFQYVSVTFNSTANANTEIPHTLAVGDPEEVDYAVVDYRFTSAPATVPVVYRDVSTTRRAWGKNYIVLRSNVAALSATLLLTVRR